MTPTDFAKLYVAHQPPAFAPFYMGSFLPGPLLQPAQRTELAKNLSTQINPATGRTYIVDDEIEAGGYHPFYAMQQRLRYGQARWPSLAQILAMGGIFPANFDYTEASLEILNSLTPADYPPYTGPVPVVTDYVGDYAGGGRYNARPGSELEFKNGDVLFRQGFYYQFQTSVIAGENFWVFLGRNPPDVT